MRVFLALLALLCLATPSWAAFPADSLWQPVQIQGANISDPFSDANTTRDIVGDSANPAAYYYRDASGIYLRMRLDDDPRSGNGLKPFGWGVAMEYDGDLSGYDAMVWISGVGSADQLSLYANSATDVSGSGVCDTSETLVNSTPAASSMRVVNAPSSFGSTPDYFLDFFVPESSLALLPAKAGGVRPTAGTIVQFVFGTSNSGQPALTADTGGSGTNACNLASFLDAISDPPPGTALTDTDGDGMPDYWENQYNCVDSAVNDASADPDNDGLTNLQEFEAGTDPCVGDSDGDDTLDGTDNCPFVTNPDQADQDGDGIGDACDPDIDGDGIPNGEETEVYGTDPLKEDTDGDGVSDSDEIKAGTDPTAKDSDSDGVDDGKDNCPLKDNPDQLDYDRDGQGDACETEEVPWLGGGAFGCRSASPAQFLVWLLVPLLFGLRRLRIALALMTLILFVPPDAQAVQSQRYRITPSPLGWNAVDSADVLEPGALSAGFFIQYEKDPVVFRLGDQIERKVVSGRFSGEAVAAAGVFPRIELGVGMPAVLYQTGQGLEPPRFDQPPPAFASGNLSVRPRIALLTPDDIGADWGVTLTPTLLAPTARADGFAGEDAFVLQPELAVSTRIDDWAISANVGYTMREQEQLRSVSQDDAALYRLAAAWRWPGLIWTAELLGETSIKKPFSNPAANPLELDVGALYELAPSLQFSASAGSGLSPGLGSPVLRVISGIRWTPNGQAGPFAGEPLEEGELARLAGGKIELGENVRFETGRDQLTSSSSRLLNAVAKILKDNPDLHVKIIGHTDEVGSTEANQKLSERRAVAVKKYLERRGIAKSRMDTEGKGETEPLVSNETPEGREKNRRVEFHVE